MKLKKGSAAAKAFMARLRAMQKNPKRRRNPRRKLTAADKRKRASARAYLSKASQATKRPPSSRLKRRRAANVQAGTYPNPRRRRRKSSKGWRIVAKVRGRLAYWIAGTLFDTDRSQAKALPSQAKALAVAQRLTAGPLKRRRLYVQGP